MTQSELVQNRFDLDLALLRENRAKQVVEAVLRQAKYDLRNAKVSQAEYGGSFRSFRDRLSGRREETETALRHAVQKAETALASAQQALASLETRISGLKEQSASLPDWESLKDGSPEWYRLDALYCIQVLGPLLEITLALLAERRAQFNGTNAGQIKTLQDLADIYSAPEVAGEDCRPYVLRLKEALAALGIPFELSSFFDAPTVFLSSATQFTRMDRVNTAIAQTEKLQQYLSNLNNQLER